jgi:hypothetical protein
MGQLLRQGLRAVAIYFSDVLLWLSVAGIFEVLFFVVAGALCILTAGFVFDSMKRSPVVLVLGSIVALTGTFLVFREVRGLVWPIGPDAAIATPSPIQRPPETGSTPSPSPDVPRAGAPPGLGASRLGSCSGWTREMCSARSACFWSFISSACMDKASPPAGGSFQLPTATPEGLSLCAARSTRLMCSVQPACYWSPLTQRCEKLIFGGRLGLGPTPAAPAPAKASCPEVTRASICLTTAGCSWALGRCYYSTLPGGR